MVVTGLSLTLEKFLFLFWKGNFIYFIRGILINLASFGRLVILGLPKFIILIGLDRPRYYFGIYLGFFIHCANNCWSNCHNIVMLKLSTAISNIR